MTDPSPIEGLDLQAPIEIADGIFWVGRREGTLLERNIYLRVFGRPSTSRVSMLIDPGPPSDLAIMSEKVGKVIGNVRNVNVVYANHQDPDVTYNAAYLQKLNPNLFVLCSEDTWRLIHFYGLNPARFRATESFKDMRTRFPSDHVVQFVPSPFCHFRGAVMLYDPESRILFTGDLFGGLSYHPGFYATEKSWDGIKTFHQIYMPSRDALQLAVKTIRALNPAPLMIAPQHGGIIQGELIEYFLDKVSSLDVGLDLLRDSQNKDNYVAAFNELLIDLGESIDKVSVAGAMKAFRADGSFPNILTADERGIRDIKIDARTAVDHFTRVLIDHLPEHRNAIEMSVMRTLLGRNIPLPEALVAAGAQSPEFLDEV